MPFMGAQFIIVVHLVVMLLIHVFKTFHLLRLDACIMVMLLLIPVGCAPSSGMYRQILIGWNWKNF
jgi:hypothetical protein